MILKWFCSAVFLMTATLAFGQPSDAPSAKTIKVPFVRLQPGQFTMGVGRTLYGPTRRELSYDHPYSVQIKGNEQWNEQPAHLVRLTKPFDIAVHEITVGQFRQFVEATGHVTDAEKNGTALGFNATENDQTDRKLHFKRFAVDEKFTWKNPGFPQEDKHPVVCVSWRDAQAFCDWLSKTEDATYRLPTEAEWEYACKAGTDTWYSFGNKPDEAYSYANVADAALEQAHPGLTKFQRIVKLEPGDGDGIVYTASVGRLKANPWGLHDVHGNVWEWVADKYEELHYRARIKETAKQQKINEEEVITTNPQGPVKTTADKFGDWRVIRGGGWNVAPINCRSTMRAYGESGDAFCYTGFRLVREVK